MGEARDGINRRFPTNRRKRTPYAIVVTKIADSVVGHLFLFRTAWDARSSPLGVHVSPVSLLLQVMIANLPTLPPSICPSSRSSTGFPGLPHSLSLPATFALISFVFLAHAGWKHEDDLVRMASLHWRGLVLLGSMRCWSLRRRPSWKYCVNLGPGLADTH